MVVVAYRILVSAHGPLILGFWVWGFGVWGLGLTIMASDWSVRVCMHIVPDRILKGFYLF